MYMHNHNTVVSLLYHTDQWGHLLLEGPAAPSSPGYAISRDQDQVGVAQFYASHDELPR